MKKIIQFLICLSVIVASGFLGIVIYKSIQLKQKVITGKYQIVFLDNNQFYFCRLEDYNKEFYLCKNAFYLKSKQVKSKDPRTGKEITKSQLYLAKLGTSELHQPTSNLWIKKDKVIIIENFAKDSKILQAIRDYKPESSKNTQQDTTIKPEQSDSSK